MDEKWSENIDVWKAQKKSERILKCAKFIIMDLNKDLVNTRHKTMEKMFGWNLSLNLLTGVDDAELVIERSECFLKLNWTEKIIDNNSVGCFWINLLNVFSFRK